MPRKNPRPQAKKWAARRKAQAQSKEKRRSIRVLHEENGPVTPGMYAALAAIKMLGKDT